MEGKNEGGTIAGNALASRICEVTDTITVSSRKITDHGFLEAPAILARTGVQQYTRRELGITDGDPTSIIRLYRPADEVFNPESMSSFEANPITLNHPKGNRVAADNWRNVAVGDVHGVHQSPDGMAGRVVIRDARAVKAVQQDGKTALSNGYTFTLDPTPGTTEDGQVYDGIQRNIRGNHVAIVDVARGGPICQIADSAGGDAGATEPKPTGRAAFVDRMENAWNANKEESSKLSGRAAFIERQNNAWRGPKEAKERA